jgi:GNAT superfamily N-acetyltransferase
MRLAERISVERWHPGDQEWAAGCHAVQVAAHMADDPRTPPDSAPVFGMFLADGWEHNPGEVWYLPSGAVPSGDVAGPVAAYYRVDFPDLENRDRAEVDLRVHPALRRRGIGGALLAHAAARAAANGRAVLETEVLNGSAGEGFLRSLGATTELEEVRRVQDVGKIAPGRIAELRAEAERAAAGYSLLRWTGTVPEEYAGQYAGVINAFNDAPKGENVEDRVWTAERVLERRSTFLRADLVRGYSVAAKHVASGEMVAVTDVVIDPTWPDWGWQQLTAVTRTHRGHRLGLLVKTAMLEWLAEAEPQLERIETGNAAANEHMIAVNETLGYEVMPPGWQFYEIGVETVLANTGLANTGLANTGLGDGQS